MENLEETLGYKTAIAFKPFISEKCTEHMEIVKDMARAINGTIKVSLANSADKNTENEMLKERLRTIVAFESNERVVIAGITYMKGINEHSFYSRVVVL